MGRHKLPYKMKKPNNHHKYWRYVLSSDPNQSERSTRTKVKYQAERIAKEAYQDSLDQQDQCITFGKYAADFFLEGKCRLTKRRNASNKPITVYMLKMKRGHLINYLLPQFSDTKLDEISLEEFEDWRLKVDLANSTKNGITVTMKQILNEAIREKIITVNPLDKVETLSEVTGKTRDSLSVEEMKKLFPVSQDQALKIWGNQKYYTLMFVMISSGMRSGEVRALTWEDVIWDDCGVLITKAIKNKGEVGSVKENKEKFVRLPEKTITLLKEWKEKSLASDDKDFIFYGKKPDKPIDRGTILSNFRKGLKRAEVGGEGKNLVPHSLRHTFNSYMLSVLPSNVVRKFTGHSSEQMTKRYYHPMLKEELKNTEIYQSKIDEVWTNII